MRRSNRDRTARRPRRLHGDVAESAVMTSAPDDVAALTDVFSAILRGEPVAWPAIGRSSADFVAACLAEDLIVLVHERVAGLQDCEWPPSVRNALAARAHAAV